MLIRPLGVSLAAAVLVGGLHAQSPLMTLQDRGNQLLRSSVAGAGDLDADGHADILVGAPSFAGPQPHPYYSPGAAGRVSVVSVRTGTVLRHWDGGGPGDRFGDDVDGPGDLDGDGVPDVLVGSPGTYNNAGRVYLYSGATGATLRSWTGADYFDYLGKSVSRVGDVDDDGYPDVLAGAPGVSVGPLLGGVVRVYSGQTGALIREWTSDLGQFGVSVAGLGDVDDDGVPDIAAGSIQSGSGSVRVFSGATASQLWVVPALGGDRMRGCGDTNADGVPDLAVSELRLARVLSGAYLQWVAQPGGQPGAFGIPTLTGEGAPVAGGTVQLHLEGAALGAQAIVVLGIATGPGPFLGAVIVPQPLVVLDGLTTSAAGTLDLAVTVPEQIVTTGVLYAQAWIRDDASPTGSSTSHPLAGTVAP